MSAFELQHEEGKDKPLYNNPNLFPLSDGRVVHMDLAEGDLASRIITVGAASRAEIIASFFDHEPPVKKIVSHRGFVTFTGFYHGVHVSVVAIGIGLGVIDLFVRESRAVVRGPMAIIRFGTCGGLDAVAAPGTIAVASEGSGYITRNPNAFSAGNTEKPYLFYNRVDSDAHVSEILAEELGKALGEEKVVKGLNITADSFYSSQARHDDRFDDRNDTVIADLKAFYAGYDLVSFEMESFLLLHLSHCARPESIKSSAAAIILANRALATVIEDQLVGHMEKHGGEAVLKAIVRVEL